MFVGEEVLIIIAIGILISREPLNRAETNFISRLRCDDICDIILP